MAERIEILGFGLQGRTILEFLKEKMDGRDRPGRRKSFKERFRLTGIGGCCGGVGWGLVPSTISVMDDEEDEGQGADHTTATEASVIDNPAPFSGQSTGTIGVNLATALAAEREFRSAQEREYYERMSIPRPSCFDETGPRMSLMRLLDETSGQEEEVDLCDSSCCVCMVRKRGAAFIPCGHTFCRVCSREVCLNRGCCPLCNRSIVEILDIY